jgi:hypothetical protein
MKYGKEPEYIGNFSLQCDEMMFYQYLPIKMPNLDFRLPPNLKFLEDLRLYLLTYDDDKDYIYATVKKMYVSPDCPSNRPGWHCDGFGTKDLNYIWYDSVPTEFCVQEFDLSDDHNISMYEMERQARKENIITFPNNSLLLLDQTVVHRVAECKEPGFRTFVKISISDKQYNLKGNSHNYLFDYEWEMFERTKERNHPMVDYKG